MKHVLAHGMFFGTLRLIFVERPIVQQNFLNPTKLCDYQVMLLGAYFIRLCLPCYLRRNRVLVFRLACCSINLWLLRFSPYI